MKFAGIECALVTVRLISAAAIWGPWVVPDALKSQSPRWFHTAAWLDSSELDRHRLEEPGLVRGAHGIHGLIVGSDSRGTLGDGMEEFRAGLSEIVKPVGENL